MLPDHVPNCRIISAGYDSKVMGTNATSQSLSSLARHVATDIQGLREEGCIDRPVIFVAHSTGGLVVKSMLEQELMDKPSQLREEAPVLYNTKAIIFLGTPHRGLKILDNLFVYYWMLRGLGLLPSLPYRKQLVSGSYALHELSIAFGKVLKQVPISIVSCYETIASTRALGVPHNGFVVPEKEAVIGLPNETPCPLDKRHAELARIEGETDFRGKRLLSVISNEIKKHCRREPVDDLAVLHPEPHELPAPSLSILPDAPPVITAGSFPENADYSNNSTNTGQEIATVDTHGVTLVPVKIEMVLGLDIVLVDAMINRYASYNSVSREFLLHHNIDIPISQGVCGLSFCDLMTRKMQTRPFLVQDMPRGIHVFLAPSTASAVSTTEGTRSPSRGPSARSSVRSVRQHVTSTARTSWTAPSPEKDYLEVPRAASPERSAARSADLVGIGMGLAESLARNANTENTMTSLNSALPVPQPHPLSPLVPSSAPSSTPGPNILSRIGTAGVRAVEETAPIVATKMSDTTKVAIASATVAGVLGAGGLATSMYNAHTAGQALEQSRLTYSYTVQKDAKAEKEKEEEKLKKKEKKQKKKQARSVRGVQKVTVGSSDEDSGQDSDQGGDDSTMSGASAVPVLAQVGAPATRVGASGTGPQSLVPATRHNKGKQAVRSGPIVPDGPARRVPPRPGGIIRRNSAPTLTAGGMHRTQLLNELKSLPPVPSYVVGNNLSVVEADVIESGLHDPAVLRKLTELPQAPQTDPSGVVGNVIYTEERTTSAPAKMKPSPAGSSTPAEATTTPDDIQPAVTPAEVPHDNQNHISLTPVLAILNPSPSVSADPASTGSTNASPPEPNPVRGRGRELTPSILSSPSSSIFDKNDSLLGDGDTAIVTPGISRQGTVVTDDDSLSQTGSNAVGSGEHGGMKNDVPGHEKIVKRVGDQSCEGIELDEFKLPQGVGEARGSEDEEVGGETA
ncbi:hypothetical protein QBC43DRAFT_114543 [Cladorrhinum sp. PSN259]|nr:hypothetical protein QBC43DRAFT_114543 [Cladorrhinum sp. PSN259]